MRVNFRDASGTEKYARHGFVLAYATAPRKPLGLIALSASYS